MKAFEIFGLVSKLTVNGERMFGPGRGPEKLATVLETLDLILPLIALGTGVSVETARATLNEVVEAVVAVQNLVGEFQQAQAA